MKKKLIVFRSEQKYGMLVYDEHRRAHGVGHPASCTILVIDGNLGHIIHGSI